LNTKLSTCDEKRVFSDDDDTGNAWQEVGKKKGVEEDIGLLSGFNQTQEHLSLIKLKNPNQSELQKKLDRCPWCRSIDDLVCLLPRKMWWSLFVCFIAT
jgi:hypothetical protein